MTADSRLWKNTRVGKGMETRVLENDMADGEVSLDAEAAEKLLRACPRYEPTPLVSAPAVAERLGVRKAWLKDESKRMGLGSFKALGAAYAIAKDVVASSSGVQAANGERTTTTTTYVAASAGNHGISLAAGARVFGARAVIYLCEQVPEYFAERLRGMGAEVVRAGKAYDESCDAARRAAEDNAALGWKLLSDSSWPGYSGPPTDVMEGYLIIAREIERQIERQVDASGSSSRPTHVFLQAGVGGLAAAVGAYLRHVWGDGVTLVVVEPTAAPCIFESVCQGRPTAVPGPVSNMGRLDCKVPSQIALKALARVADGFALVTDDEASEAASLVRGGGGGGDGIETTASGAAGVAGAMLLAASSRRAATSGSPPSFGIDRDSVVLAIVSEGHIA